MYNYNANPLNKSAITLPEHLRYTFIDNQNVRFQHQKIYMEYFGQQKYIF